MSSASSCVLEDRSQPLVNNNPSALIINDRILTHYVDVAENDNSCHAHIVRAVAYLVGSIFVPRQILAILRVLKAISLLFIVLTILANFMYILFVEVFTSDAVQEMTGGVRDTLLRLFALLLSLIALAIEVDYTKVVKLYIGLKAFIPRALLYLFIAIITSSHPVVAINQKKHANGNDANQMDDAFQDDSYYKSASSEIPSSAVAFQMVTSFVLGGCGFGYLACGMLCFDRFTALAFISTKDPRVTTAIPPTMMDSGSSLDEEQLSDLSEGVYS